MQVFLFGFTCCYMILLTKALALVGTGYILCPYLVSPPQFHVHCTIDFIVLVSSTLNLFKASFSDERGQTVWNIDFKAHCRFNFPAALCLKCTAIIVCYSLI